MAAKATLLKAKSDLEVAQGLEEMHLAIEAQTNSIRADALRLALVEYLQENDAVKAKEIFDTIDTPKRSANNATLHRLNARWWTCKSYLQSSMRRVALREAITQHRAAGCPRAAKTLEAQLHSLL
jgi:hypothetical protein